MQSGIWVLDTEKELYIYLGVCVWMWRREKGAMDSWTFCIIYSF